VSALNRCRAGGALVGAGRIFGPEPFDYLWPKSDMVIGCNRLQCSQCGKLVRSRAGYYHGPNAFDAGPRVFETEDWETLIAPGVLIHVDDERLYACACRRETESVERYLDEEEQPPPWRCAGHPRLAIPGRLDGIEISIETNFEQLAQYALSQRLVAERPSAAVWKKSWLTRLFNLLSHEPLAERLSRAVLGEVENPDPVIRVEAIEFFRRNPKAPGAERLVELGRRHAEWFAGVANPFSPDTDMLYYLLQALAAQLDAGERAPLEFVRARLLEPGPKPGYLIGALQRHDSEWLKKNRSAILSANLQLADIL
jgi:hypothetical protein